MHPFRILALLTLALFLASAAAAQGGPGFGPGPGGPGDGPMIGPDDGPMHGPMHGPGMGSGMGPGMGPDGRGKGPRGDMKRKMEAWREGRPAEEVEAYERTIRRIREKSEIHLQMAKILVDKKEFDKALATVRKVLAMEIPDGPLKEDMLRKKAHVYLMAVNVAEQAGMEAEAEKLLAEGLAAAKDAPEVALHLYKRSADMLRKKGKLDEALALLEKAAELSDAEEKD